MFLEFYRRCKCLSSSFLLMALFLLNTKFHILCKCNLLMCMSGAQFCLCNDRCSHLEEKLMILYIVILVRIIYGTFFTFSFFIL